MMVDTLRHCKKKFMWWDAAHTKGSWVRWYFCVPGTRPLPFPHCYTSETFDPVHWWVDGPGEDFATNPIYDKGALPDPAPLALTYCGDPLWWQYGAPSDAPPASAGCCIPPNLRGAYSRAYSPAWDRLRVGP